MIQNQVAIPQNRPSNMQVAPVSGNDAGIRRAEIKQGLREVVACKDAEGKIGLRIRHVNNVGCTTVILKLSIFVSLHTSILITVLSNI